MARQSHTLWIRLKSTSNGRWIAPPRLRRLLVKDARSRGLSLNDVAVEILSKKYKVPFTPSGRRSALATAADILNLRVPAVLWKALGAAASGSRQKEAIRVLSDHYDLKVPGTSRQA